MGLDEVFCREAYLVHHKPLLHLDHLETVLFVLDHVVDVEGDAVEEGKGSFKVFKVWVGRVCMVEEGADEKRITGDSLDRHDQKVVKRKT